MNVFYVLKGYLLWVIKIDEHVIIRQAEALDINAKPKVANMFQG